MKKTISLTRPIQSGQLSFPVIELQWYGEKTFPVTKQDNVLVFTLVNEDAYYNRSIVVAKEDLPEFQTKLQELITSL